LTNKPDSASVNKFRPVNIHLIIGHNPLGQNFIRYEHIGREGWKLSKKTFVLSVSVSTRESLGPCAGSFRYRVSDFGSGVFGDYSIARGRIGKT
jgi:hypothetical protein